MCTFAWGSSGDGLWACFNRDEQRSRRQAELPAFHKGPSGPLAYCRDPEGGGSWLAVSGRGFAVVLLNHYPDGAEASLPGKKSRGLLVTLLAGQKGIAQALHAFGREPVSAYNPFNLYLLSPGTVHAYAWDGKALAESVPDLPFLTTSSFKPDAVCAWRRQRWLKWTEDDEPAVDAVAAFLREAHAPDPAFGFTMDRTDARTLSQTCLSLQQDQFRMIYRERETEGTGYQDPLVLEFNGSPQ